MALPPEAVAFRCPGSHPERKLGIWICSMHDVLAVHAEEGFQARVGREPPLPQEQLEPLDRSHAPAVGAVGSVHRNCFHVPRFQHPRHRSEEDRHRRTGRRHCRGCWGSAKREEGNSCSRTGELRREVDFEDVGGEGYVAKGS
jgi:hypothetical protein